MNNVNVGVEVGPTNTPAPTGRGNTGSQTSSNGEEEIVSTTAAKTTPSGDSIVSPGEDAGLAIFAVLFIIIALMILVFVFRDQLITYIEKTLKKLKK